MIFIEERKKSLTKIKINYYDFYGRKKKLLTQSVHYDFHEGKRKSLTKIKINL